MEEKTERVRVMPTKKPCVLSMLLILVLVACRSNPAAQLPISTTEPSGSSVPAAVVQTSTRVQPSAPAPSPTPVLTDTPEPEPSPTPVLTDTPEPEPSPTPALTDTPEPEPSPTPVLTDTPEPEPSPTPVLTDTPEPEPTSTPFPTATPELLFYNMPPATLLYSTGLYASPSREEQTVPVEIPAEKTVYVMGRNDTGSHLRVVFGTGVGWVPVSFTDCNGNWDRLGSLPVFTREPPSCAAPITTQFRLNSPWTSDRKQRIAVVVDLFRSRYGDLPPSFLSLTVNGSEVESTRRQIVERGQFSLKDVVFTLPGYVQPGDTVGYLLNTTSDEPLSFMATIFNVPENCEWDTK